MRREEEDAFVDTFGPRIADDLWTYTRPTFTERTGNIRLSFMLPLIIGLILFVCLLQ